jgi:YebC/PmpR family DNA-binding regulatory protein
MSGHSHWATIKHKKGATDAKRGRVFSKLVRAIMVAARGGGDPAFNIRLRHSIDKAKAMRVPRDSIERAIKKGSGELEGEQLDEITYEGYGPGGVALIIETVTDNSNRTQPELRKIFESAGGKLGSSGATAWMFKRKGLFGVSKEVEEDRLIEVALEAGADDVKDVGSSWEITCAAEDFYTVQKALAEGEIATDVAELVFIADNEIELEEEMQRRNLRLMETIDEHDDVQNVYAAFTPDDKVVDSLAEG